MSNLTTARELLERHWGYKDFWPLQERAVASAVDGRDSLVVLPTGGGKSLCYQLPALCLPGMAVVVSPLIALMKDQVDSLQSMGVEAGRLTSGMEGDAQHAVYRAMDEGRLKLLYVSPERLAMRGFLDELSYLHISFFAIDEAHCISHWGHDFRPEYRMLAAVRERFGLPFHAYTATATERVREDIINQLALRNPEVCVGNFDRPNLQYRFGRRAGSVADSVERVLKRHDGEAGIVYCITRKDVEELAATLSGRGYQVIGYHAGMDPRVRDRVQDDFMNERTNVIIATVAFGMGIDRPDVRFVVHTGLPRSVEHYQQEAGRAGRDGLPAECLIYYTLGDLKTWEFIINRSDGDNAGDAESRAVALQQVQQMYRFADGYSCRHRALVEYFGQEFPKMSCEACDVCLGEHEEVSDAQTIALKILSGVVRTGERYGGQYVAETLKGSSSERIVQNGHDTLSTYGILSSETLAAIRSYVEQLESQGFLELAGADYPVYRVTAAGWRLLKERDLSVRLITPPVQQKRNRKRERFIEESLRQEDVPTGLFAALRDARRDIAKRDGYPPYIICHDKTLILLAARRPRTLDELREIPGFGQKKAQMWGEDLLNVIRTWNDD